MNNHEEVTIRPRWWTDVPGGLVVWQDSGEDQTVVVENGAAQIVRLPAGCEWRVSR